MSDRTGKGKPAEKKGKTVILLCVCVILILLVVIFYLTVGRKEDGEEETRRNVVVNQKNAEEIAEQMVEEAQSYVEPGYYTVSMSTEWNFDKGDGISSDAVVHNLAENTNDVYFDVFLSEDESEAVYQSPVIPRGGYLENIALDKALEKGTHDCVIVYHLIDENQETVSTLRVAFRIVVAS